MRENPEDMYVVLYAFSVMTFHNNYHSISNRDRCAILTQQQLLLGVIYLRRRTARTNGKLMNSLMFLFTLTMDEPVLHGTCNVCLHQHTSVAL